MTKLLAVEETKSWSRCAETLGWYLKERGDSSSGVRSIIISEFDNRC